MGACKVDACLGPRMQCQFSGGSFALVKRALRLYTQVRMPSDPADTPPSRDPLSAHQPQLEADLWDFDDAPGSAAAPSAVPTDPPETATAAVVESTPEKSSTPVVDTVTPPNQEEAPAIAPQEATAPANDGAPSGTERSVWSLIPNYTRAEIISLAACATLTLGLLIGIGAYIYHIVPTRSSEHLTVDVPVSGKHMKVTAVTTYWREPRRSGNDADRARVEAKMIPVVDLDLKGAAGAVRVFFRDDHGHIIGDVITRTVSGDQKVSIAATTGFTDTTALPSYRSGTIPSWTVEVREAPSATVATEDFHRLFLIDISPDQH